MSLLFKEHDLQVHIFDVLRLNEESDDRLKWIYAVPNGGHTHYSVANRLKAEGVKSGVSDICLPFPGTVEGSDFYGAYIEMKAGTNKLSEKQIAFQCFLDEQNYATRQFWHYDPALDFIEQYCGLKLWGRERKPRKL